jgi:hydrogenase expression/formation protein HypC
MCLAVPGEVVRLYSRDDLAYADVSFGGVTRQVCLQCEPQTQLGDFVLVHVGFAIARIDRAEAARVWALLRELGQEDEALEGGSREGS